MRLFIVERITILHAGSSAWLQDIASSLLIGPVSGPRLGLGSF